MLLLVCCGGYQELGISRRDYAGNQLRIDGFYYCKTGEKSLDYNGIRDEKGNLVGEVRDHIRGLLFYRNGVVENFSFHDYKRDSSLIFTRWPNVLLVWGTYKIEKDSIQVEYWEASSGGKAKSVIYSGVVTSDTSFVFTNFFSHYDYKNRAVNQHYQFHKLEQKPDSTNNFIK